MPFKVTDNQTGKVITFDNKPTDQDINEAFGVARQGSTPTPKTPSSSWQDTVSSVARPVLETAGMIGGGLLGSGAAPIAGTVAGAGLGYAAGKQVANKLDEALGVKKPEPMLQALMQAGKDVGTGATYEMGGQVAGKAIGAGLQYAGAGLKQLIGATTGSGPGAVEEALKGSPAFKASMRGQTTGQDVVDSAKTALQTLKTQRAAAYQSQLAPIAEQQGQIDATPIRNKLLSLMQEYNVKPMQGGKWDYSRIAMGKTGRKDISEIVDKVSQWGTQPGDETALGLDALKRQLDDFYSDSSQARAFVSSLRNAVKDTIVKNVPEYGEMTKGYAEASNLIKDIESNLMLRKEGMSGRITADQTLRRLTSAMRENFEMRRDLLNVLGNKAGQDLAGEVAGYSMSPVIPRGLISKLAGGYAGWFVYLHPQLWPLLAASSPRVMGEFLGTYGKALNEMKGVGAPLAAGATKAGAVLANQPQKGQ